MGGFNISNTGCPSVLYLSPFATPAVKVGDVTGVAGFWVNLGPEREFWKQSKQCIP